MSDEKDVFFLESTPPSLALEKLKNKLEALPVFARREKFARVFLRLDVLFAVRLLQSAFFASGMRQRAGQVVFSTAFLALFDLVRTENAAFFSLWRAAAQQMDLRQVYFWLDAIEALVLPQAKLYVPLHVKSFASEGMTLGHRMAKARVATLAEMEPLLLDPAGQVLAVLLRHPKTTLEQVLLAVRQKCATSEGLSAVVESKFVKNPTVAFALAQAAHISAESALRILPYLSEKERLFLAASASETSAAVLLCRALYSDFHDC